MEPVQDPQRLVELAHLAMLRSDYPEATRLLSFAAQLAPTDADILALSEEVARRQEPIADGKPTNDEFDRDLEPGEVWARSLGGLVLIVLGACLIVDPIELALRFGLGHVAHRSIGFGASDYPVHALIVGPLLLVLCGALLVRSAWRAVTGD